MYYGLPADFRSHGPNQQSAKAPGRLERDERARQRRCRTVRIGRSTALHFTAQVVRSVAGFVGTLAIARFLGSSGLGSYAVIVAFATWLSIPTTAIARATNKRVSEGQQPSEMLGAGILTQVAVTLALVVAVVTATGRLTEYVSRDVALQVAMLVAAIAMFKVVIASIRGEKRVGVSGVLDAIEQAFRTVIQVGLLLGGFAVFGLVAGHALSLVAATLVGMAIVSLGPAMPRVEHVRRLLSYARYNWLNVFETRSFAWMDTVVLALFVSPSLIGIYEVAWRLASVLGLVSVSVQQTLFPELSDLSTRGDFERVKHLIDEGLVYTGLFVVPGLFGAAVIGREVLKIYRPEFTQGATILLILIGARIARAYSGPFVNAINAIDRPDIAFRIDAVFIAVNLVLNVALVWAIGWYGAAIATALSTVLALVLGYFSLRNLVGTLPIPVGEFGRQIVAGAFMGGVVWATTLVLPTNHYVTVGQVVIGAVVYSLVLLSISERVRSKAIALGRSTALLR